MEDNSIKAKSRRSIIIKLAAVAAAPVLAIAGKAFAQSKLAKDAVKYQNKPAGGKDCDDCIQFVPGKTAKAMGICKVVEGPISPKGWCIAFAEKPQKHG